MYRILGLLLLLSITLLFLGCSMGQGPDSIFLGSSYPGGTRAGCTQYCHNATSNVPPYPSPDPLPTGRHSQHVIEEGISCTACHYQYVQRLTHMDGTLQTTGFVIFDAFNPAGQFNYSTLRCSSLACHGGETW